MPAPMRVLERSVYVGPNLYGLRPKVRVRLDLGTLEERPTDRLPGFTDALLEHLPGLARHGCSYREAGGLVRRMREGTWLGHVIEHVAIELQSRAGAAVTRGKTRSVKGLPGVYDILFRYADPASGLAAGRAAIALVATLLPPELQDVEGLDLLGDALPGEPTDVAAVVAALRQRVAAGGFGPSTQALVDEARRRGIPTLRLDQASLVQLGYGSRQRRIRASVTGGTSLIGAELAGNKDAAKALLHDAGLPVPRGQVVHDADEAVRAARRLGWPLVVKPLDGNHGRGVTTGIRDEAGVREGVALAARISRRVIVERELPGNDHRILVVDGKVVAVAERVPAHVVGDGRRTITALIDAVNADPRRGDGHQNVLTRIVVDEALRGLLAQRGLDLTSVPGAGERVQLRGTANLSSGGTAVDRTDVIHPDNAAIAEQAAAVIGLDVAGIDLLSPDITRSVRETGGGIVEVNAAPGLRMHLQPSEGTPRDVARPIVAAIVPPGARSRIPIFAVTGTNGKSTTVRMVARILCEAGYRVGLTSTSGVYIDGRLHVAADASGPRSARMVLRNPTVDAAVFEAARGGILREGLGFDYCDVGAVLNVTADHLGLKGIDTVEDLARVKSVVSESVGRRGHAVLSADDPMTRRMARHAGGRVVWFSDRPDAAASEPIRAHLAEGGMAAVQEAGEIVVYRGQARLPVLPVAAIPATLEGAAEFNVLNALAATAMTASYGVPTETIAAALHAFTTSFEDSPGRLNILDAHGVRVIVDYAHNPAALTALGRLIAKMRRDGGRVFGMVSIPGDRRDCDLIEMGELAAGIFDEIMFREAPDGRGRPAGSINAMMSQGAISAGIPADRVHRLVNEEDATDECLRRARAGDMVVLMPTDVDGIWRRVNRFAEQGPPVLAAATGRVLETADG
jgi:cyanophycin synthetase